MYRECRRISSKLDEIIIIVGDWMLSVLLPRGLSKIQNISIEKTCNLQPYFIVILLARYELSLKVEIFAIKMYKEKNLIFFCIFEEKFKI